MSQQQLTSSATTTNEEQQTVVEDHGPPPKIQMKLHILQIIKQKQNENGLKHLDYDSYRRYCTKRLRKLRTLLDMKHKKEAKFTQTPKKKKKNLKSTPAAPTTTTTTTNTTITTSVESSTTTPTTVVDGIKNSSLYSQKKVSDKIVERYKEKKEIQIKNLREQALRNLIRENVEKQIHEQKEKLLSSFAKKKKKESKKTDKNIQYDPEFLSELYTHINTNPTITENEIEERVKKMLQQQSGDSTELDHLTQGSNTMTTATNENTLLVNGDERFLHLLLVQAERAWSHSRHLKNEMKQYPDNSRIKFHQLNRLKKAVKWSKLLLDYCNMFCENDQRTILEAEAYHSYMSGLLFLEKEDWAESLKLFKQSQTVYDQLYKVLTFIPQALREEYKKQVNEIAVNYMRLCEYNLKKIQGGELLLQQLESNSQQLDLIQLKLSQVKDSEDKNLPSQQKVEWEGVMSIIIPNEKIRVNLANGKALLDADYKTVESKLRAFDKLFGIYNDTMRMIREEMKTLSSGGTSSNTQKRTHSSHTSSSSQINSNFSSLSVTEQLNQLRFLHSYVSYVLGTKTIERNVIMLQSLLDRLDTIQQQKRVEKKQKTNPVDIIRLFDGLLQNVNDLSDLLQSINIHPDSAKKLQTDLDEKKNIFTSYRCYYMAHAYASQHKWTECYLLLERSEQLLSQLMKNQSSSSSSLFSLPNPTDILSEIRKAKITAKSQQVLSNKKHQGTSILAAYDSDDDEKETSKKQQQLVKLMSEKPLTSRMDQFIIPNKTVVENLQSYSLVELPPKYQVIPNKPVFFDIANSLVCEYPTEFIDEQVKELSKSVEKPTTTTTTEEPKKKGWFGLW
ncbi:hypothetical protein C9374_011607 [Naegleria lovaniensis]|uniref:Signal recognition particle subunit SRP68 n=1 Tax=Naegleria lovaniensis TaxID=51637 RepID=A0AA88KIH8_NAELO|nr:uncharacterized protein C9374_011607 [Naegleria lovaniensis]KAG2373942.1 hypothetical protein C9374_011607 [Naegleria lovaniensis]